MAYVFARRDLGAFVVAHPANGMHVALEQGRAYDENDPLVEAHPWAFVTADELGDTNQDRHVTEAPVEAATRRPGQKRSARKPAK